MCWRCSTVSRPHRWICALDVYYDTSPLPSLTWRASHASAVGQSPVSSALSRPMASAEGTTLPGTRQSILVERDGLGRTEGFTLTAIAAGQPGEIVEATITGHDGARLLAAPLTARAA